ncbi:MAG: RAMP superfamily CRISPR-associated protein [Candidatus Desantisbacteria bacterium]
MSTKVVWRGYKVELTTLEPFRIGGAGHVLSDINNPVVMLKGDLPVIPGTSLKGAWRSQMERFLIDYLGISLEKGEERGLKPCIPASEITPDERALIGKYKRKKEKDRYSNDHSPCTYDNKSDYICPACYLLGAMTLQGFVRVPFLFPVEGQEELETLLYSIREDRAKGGAAKGQNRDWPVINPGVKFEGMIEVLEKDELKNWYFGQERRELKHKNLDRWLKDTHWSKENILADLFKKCLESIEILGGFKSKGCGRVSIAIDLTPQSDYQSQLIARYKESSIS